MIDTLLRPATSTIPTPSSSDDGVKDDTGVSTHDPEAPIDLFEDGGNDIVLSSLGIQEDVKSLPEADQSNLKEVKQYVLDIIKKSGDSPTMGAFQRTLNDIKADMGLSYDADPSTILDRIGGVLKAWKSLVFIKDKHQKKSVLYKLMRAQDSKEMNRIVFETMDGMKLWQ